jgi:hypothetical protein
VPRSRRDGNPPVSNHAGLGQVAGKGVAESSARGREIVAGESGCMGGRHDARVIGQGPVGRVELGGEHVEAKAG